MKKTLTAILLATLFSPVAMSQSKFNVSGTVIEKGIQEPVMSATVQVLSLPDSTFVDGAATSTLGAFEIKSIKKGKYALKVSYIGYQTRVLPLDLTKEKKKDVDMGYITLETDAVMLKEAQVTANAAKVQVSGDSLVYNASAYRVPAGSALEELVKRLPGAEVDDDGNVKINGKSVNKILVDGKEFFLNDTKVAMKNFNTDIIDRIKSYERKSDLARITGIDDGEEETVLDLSIKKDMKNGWLNQLNLGIGTEHRYNGRLSIQRYNDNSQFTVFGSANNVADRGFGGGGGRGWGWGGSGLRSSKEIGFNFGTETDYLETGGSVRYRYNGSDVVSETSSQNFVTPTGAFSERLSASKSSNSSVNANMRIEWKPDTMTNLMFRPNVSYSRNRSFSESRSATFNEDPNAITDDALKEIEEIEDALTGADILGVDEQLKNLVDIAVNTNMSRSQNYSENKNANGTLQFNKRLSSDGRNITVRVNGGIGDSESKQLSASSIAYANQKEVNGANVNMERNNRYYTTPARNHNYSAQVTYSEPIADRTYLQLSYRYNYSYSKNDRAAYVYDSDAYHELRDALLVNRYDVDAIIDYMAKISEPTYDAKLSQFSEYENFNHTITFQFRRVRESYNLNVGVDALPQRTTLNYEYMGKRYDEVERNVFNITPTLNFRYNFDKMTQLQVTYRGNTSQPSMTNLLDITDDSDPLNIRKGNPGLKPSFSNNLRLFFNTYNAEAQRGIFTHLNFSMTNNSVANLVEYDEATGVTTTTPQNIDGNWNVFGMFGINTALDEGKFFTLSSYTNANYSNNVGYYFDRMVNESVKSKTKNLGLSQRLELGYRNDWFEASINGNVNYNHSRNNVVKNNDLDTWNFSYGADMNIRLPWGTTIATDISQNSRRGYAQANMNTDELLWNAQISHSFLRGNALTIALEVNDILGEQSNISRVVNAMSSSDSRTNAIYQYGMLRCIYKLNIFGGKIGGQSNEGMGGFGNWGGGRPMGGPGGGRPMGGPGGRR